MNFDSPAVFLLSVYSSERDPSDNIHHCCFNSHGVFRILWNIIYIYSCRHSWSSVKGLISEFLKSWSKVSVKVASSSALMVHIRAGSTRKHKQQPQKVLRSCARHFKIGAGLLLDCKRPLSWRHSQVSSCRFHRVMLYHLKLTISVVCLCAVLAMLVVCGALNTPLSLISLSVIDQQGGPDMFNLTEASRLG